VSETKWKGAIGAARAIAAFTELKVPVFQAIASEHLPYDFVIAHGAAFLKVQVKYREAKANGAIVLPSSTSWSNSSGTHTRKYQVGDFDVMAVFVPAIDRVLFFSFRMLGKMVSLRARRTTDYYWWEDFTSFPPLDPQKRPKAATRHEKKAKKPPVRRDVVTPHPKVKRERPTKIVWPSEVVLRQLVEEHPTSSVARQLGVSDHAVRKRCVANGIPLKPRGYWAREMALKNK
jgi:hypothetical protein